MAPPSPKYVTQRQKFCASLLAPFLARVITAHQTVGKGRIQKMISDTVRLLRSAFRLQMTRILRFALLALVLVVHAPSAVPAGGITLVQHASSDAGTTNTTVLAFPSNNTAGNWIGVCIRAGALNESFTVVDSKGNIYRKAVQFAETGDGNSIGIYYSENIAGGANAIRVSASVSATLRIVILEYSGVATSGSLDAVAMNQGQSATPSSGPGGATTANGELLLGAIATANAARFTAGSGYTIVESVPAEPNTKLIVEQEIQTIAGSASASATLATSDYWGTGVATFKPTTSGGTSPNITSASNTTFNVGTAGSFTVTTTGTPTPALSETGTLPSGVTFVDNGNGTATLSGTTSIAGSYSFTVTAHNVNGTVTQAFTLTVGSASTTSSLGFVQENYATPQGTAGNVTVAYKQAQVSGNLNAVVVGWNDSTAQITSVTDTRGNAYALAAGPTVQSGTATQAIYYAQNIAAATANGNTVKVTFNIAANSPDVRIAEYSGIDPVNPIDVVTAGQGSGGASNSGSVSTGNANDLLLGANYVQQLTTGPGSGYASRVITSPDGDILEDRVVTATGSYNATASLSGGGWIMQMVAFRAASGGAGTLPSITSANSTTFTVGVAGTFTVTATGAPTPSLSEIGAMPGGVAFKDNGNGTATLSGTPAAGSAGSYSFTITAQNGAGTNATQGFTLTVNQAPAITSANNTTFGVGTVGTFAVTATGVPSPTLTESGTLPTGIMFMDKGNGSAILSGTPATGTGGSYPISIKAHNGAGADATESFTLTVTQTQEAAITSGNSTAFTVSTVGTFTVTATGTPTPSLTEVGTLPSGVTFTDNGNGTATLSGTPGSGTGGTYPLTITARNGVGSDATQTFSLAVNQAASIIGVNATTFGVGVAGTFTVSAIGTPTPSLTETGNLPNGVTFTDNGNGTATIGGTPPTGTAGSYVITIAAHNGVGTDASQAFTLTIAAAALLGFVQVNNAVPQTPQTRVTVTYLQAQMAGDLNVVVVGWNDATAQISSVTDTKGNIYAVAVGPTVQTGTATQAIYYAKNIAVAAANSNTVTITFNTTANNPDVRIAEYSGIDPLNPVDVVTAGQGSGTSSSSGSVTTGNPNDLLVGANFVQQLTTGPGPGYTSRAITSPDGDILEDQIVSTTGSYNATAVVSSGKWIMQLAAFRAAGSGGSGGGGSSVSVAVSPKRAAVTTSQQQQFTASVTDPQNAGVTWSVDGNNGGNSTVGWVSSTGLFVPGSQVGPHTVTAISNSASTVSASASIAVTDLKGVLTYHNDSGRTGQNLQEYALTPSTVSPSTFGVLFSCAVDGYVYAQPLYMANFTIGGQTRNVVFIATEHDSVYAFDADSPSCVKLWQTNFLASGVTTVPPADTGELNDLVPEIGITSTPAIDPSTGTIYVVAKTKETVGSGCSSSSPCYFHRLHALDMTSGAEKFGGPVVLSAPNFVPLYHLQRPALLLSNGTVYIGFGSHGDNNTYQGWLMAYGASTLAQQWAWHSTDPTSGNNEGAIWGSGNGPAADASGNIYVETANGVFDGASNMSDSVVKLNPAGTMVDYFTPFDQNVMQQNDIDLGSSGPIILPNTVGSATNPHLMIATGKVGVVYLLDQTNMGHYNSGANQDLGEVSVGFNTTSIGGGFFGQPAYWNGNIYTIIVGDSLRQFAVGNGTISTVASSNSSNSFPYRGATPAISGNGTANGIVWVADVSGYKSGTSVILDAYDATNVSSPLYTDASRTAAPATKFSVPTVANGKVYLGGQYAFTVFGLLPN